MDDKKLIQIIPSERQLALQSLEFYAFVHFTVNTFTDREWGDGTESPAVFNPSALDANQWAEAIKSAGMRAMILTCKHHDGFCLWPSKYTDHSVASSPWKDGKGDVVKEASDACRRAGLRFGVYLSPWDRHSPLYGSGRPYDDYFVSQLTELLTGYGDICSVWFDGACGEGPNGKKQYYDWDRYFETVRRLQPGACIHICGPDIRWCGNEAGDCRPSEWSVVPLRMKDTEKVASLSQQADNAAFRQRKLSARDLDLGSREALRNEEELIWYPAEVDTSIRPGWFWHASENDQVRPLEKLIDIYEKSVGGNATLLLNIPPDRRGLLHENDVRRLREIGDYLRSHFSRNYAPETVSLTADPAEPGHGPEGLLEKDDGRWYAPVFSEPKDHPVKPVRIRLKWASPVPVRYIVLREQIALSQRVERFEVSLTLNGQETARCEGTVVGYQKILSLPDSPLADTLTVTLTDYRVQPLLSFLGVF